MDFKDHPASFRMAERAAEVAQRRHFALLASQLAGSLAAALLMGLSVVPPLAHRSTGLRQTAASLLLVGVVLLLVSRVFRFDTIWWDSRAVAESIKSSAWRYMMRAVPFSSDQIDSAAAEAFVRQISEVRKARSAIAATLERHRSDPPEEITTLMRTTRQERLDERRRFYVQHRLDDQRGWYNTKTRFHDQRRESWFVATLTLQVVALLCAFLDWRPGGLNVVTLIIAASASLTAWAQAKRHEELAQAYALAAQELDVIGARIGATADDSTFGLTVAESEEAISREHTMWMARRNR